MPYLFDRGGGEFIVNSIRTGSQIQPQVTMLADGGFVIVWTDYSGQGGDAAPPAIKAQRFDAAGSPVGDEMLVNSTTAGEQSGAEVIATPDGGFLVLWSTRGADGNYDIIGQFFDAAGARSGGEFPVGQDLPGSDTDVTVSALPNGNYLAAWTTSGPSPTEVNARIFGSDGTPIGNEYYVGAGTSAAVAGLANGESVITWSGVGGVRAQLVSADGTLIGESFRVSTLTGIYAEGAPSVVALADGGFAVAWAQTHASGNEIRLRLFDQDGVPQGPVIEVENNSGREYAPDLAALPDGFLLTFTSPDGNSWGIHALAFDENGVASGDRFVVNEVTANVEEFSSVAILPDGRAVFTWQGTDSPGFSGQGIAARIFEPTEGPSDIQLNTDSLSEIAVSNTVVGLLGAVGAINSDFSFSIVADSTGGAFAVDGDRLILIDSRRLDFETNEEALVTIRVTDANGNSFDEIIPIRIEDGPDDLRYSAGLAQNAALTGSEYITGLTTGGFVLVGFASPSNGQSGAYGQLFNAAGQKVSDPFFITGQGAPKVSPLADGAFVVTWSDRTLTAPDSSGDAVRGQLFDSSGAKVGDSFLINTSIIGNQTLPAIDSLPSGGFVVTWSDFGTAGADSSAPSVKAQIFDAQGDKVGGELLVNTTKSGGQSSSDVEVLKDGRFVIAWEDHSGLDGDPYRSIKAQIFNEDGSRVGGEFLVNMSVEDEQAQPHIAALADGGFVIIWTDRAGGTNTIRGQMYDADGARSGPELVIAASGPGLVSGPELVGLATGGFVVAWNDRDGDLDPSSTGVKAQIFGADGSRIGDEFLVNFDTAGQQFGPTLTAFDDGRFVIGWHDAQTGQAMTRVFSPQRDGSGTVGTEGDDILSNDPSVAGDTVDALGGNDRIIFRIPTDSSLPVGVFGGVGTDTLVLEGRLENVSESAATFAGGAATITWSSIERLEVNGSPVGGAWWTTGASSDLIRLTGTVTDGVADGAARLSTAGGNDEIHLAGSFQLIDVAAGSGDDLVDLSQIVAAGSSNFVNGEAGNDRLIGSALADNLHGGAGDDFMDGGAGADIMFGGTGNDIYIVDSSGDVVGEFAGEGVDEVRTTSSVYGLQDFAFVENLTLLNSGANQAAGNEQANRITGNVGDDTLFARGGDDLLMVQQGGNDRLYGEAGRDIFYFGGALTGEDLIDGGDAVDQVVVQGDYSGARAVTLGALANVEQMFVLSGAADTYGFGGDLLLSYDIRTREETLAPGQILYVNASSLRAGETHRFDGSAETDGGRFYLYGSLGIDRLTGGAGEDVFLFSGTGILEVDDAVDGGGGYDHLLLRGSFEPVTFNASTITNVERVALLSGRDPNMGEIIGDLSYHFTLHDANVPAGALFFLDASNLSAGESVLLNGSGDLDGRVNLIGGAGNDILIGGLGNDTFEGGLGADTLQDGSGNATYVYRTAADSLPTYRDRVNGFDSGDLFDLSALDADTSSAADDAFTFIGADAFSGHAGELRASSVEAGLVRIEGDIDGDGLADFAIDVSVGANNFVFSAPDFIL